jgi:hypothetical protein
LNYTILHERDCTIIPKNPKVNGTNGTMPFDNEIKELKLIIEVHGCQHYNVTGIALMSAKHNNTTPEQELHKIQLHDRYKRIFAKLRGYFYLEIPYWNIQQGDKWKPMINNKINEILLQWEKVG